MKITIESTSRIIKVETHVLKNGVSQIATEFECRVWEGQTASGIKVQCLIPRIAALASDDLSEFERDLQEHVAPSQAVQAFPLKMII